MNVIERGTDAVATASEKINEVSEFASSKRQFIFKQVVNGILLLVILVAFGCFDFAHLKFHYEYLGDANYWYNVINKAVADICAYNVGINIIIDDAINRNKTLQKLKDLYDKLNKCKEEDFREFMEIYNRDCRIKSYKSKINHQIYRLNKYSSRRVKVLYNQDKHKEKVEGATYQQIHHTLYYRKREELEHLRSDDYIQNNIDTLNVRYRDIDPEVFDLEINGTEKVNRGKVTGSIGKGRLIASTSTLAGVIGISMFFNSWSMEPNKEEFENQMVQAWYYTLKAMEDIGVIAWQFLRGILSTHNIVSQQLTMPLEERNKILKLYYDWRKKNGKSVPKCYLESFKEEETAEYVEMTQEEFDRLKAEKSE